MGDGLLGGNSPMYAAHVSGGAGSDKPSLGREGQQGGEGELLLRARRVVEFFLWDASPVAE